MISNAWLDEPLSRALKATKGTGHLIQGIELIEKHLDREEKGLALVRNENAQGSRLSRLLLIANDGSERFLNTVESLLQKHHQRLWCIRIETSGEQLGSKFSAKGRPAKALLIDDKTALSLFFTQWFSAKTP